jgi:DNA-directed RNA polymerase specialized sigma24 family protein
MDVHEQLIRDNFSWLKRAIAWDAAFKHGLTRDEYDDLFSTVLERVWRYRDRLVDKTQEGYRNWAAVITYNAAMDEGRRKTRRMTSKFACDVDIITMALESYTLRCEQLVSDHDKEIIMKHIHAVYGDLAHLIVKKLDEGYKYSELPDHLSIHRTKIFRHLKGVREELSTYDNGKRSWHTRK